ncbi:hypothetical protein B0F90DRAFT_1813405 [Multifurca ochricompacta]|uniref:Uncharacterized protein n=1 Tax=Multifurca ochricompacta TaxID=376703 RepID=A0AAD4MCY9_9AGAM|nr:hypothetical protein B0F90DRAFT_1813405 [Multifurca ochricompacta]
MPTGLATSSTNDFDATRSIASTHESFIDLSPSSNYFIHTYSSSRARSRTVYSENSTTPFYTQHSSMRINANSMPPRGKPPLPMTPKPDFRRPASAEPSHAHITSLSAPVTVIDPIPREEFNFPSLLLERPPTTNLLLPQERVDLVRKSRKLTQLLGETPSPLSVLSRRVPESVADEAPYRYRSRPSWAPWSNVQSAGSIDTIRRHSTPSSPVDTSSLARHDDTSSLVRVLSPHTFPSPPLSRPSDSPEFMLHRHSSDEDRRHRREKIAKLHRFLGSRVPTSLALGINDGDDALPALDPAFGGARARHPGRRRSSSAAEFKSNWFDADDRVKEDLDEREKAINVRRAIKMEKMFGVQPPQTLYHTRHSPKPTDSTERPSSSEREAPLPAPASRNVNQSSYLGKNGRQNRHRASSRSESIQPLLDQSSSGKRTSAVYVHYRYSLDSLSDIIDRDDRESLAELHSILTNDQAGEGAEAEDHNTSMREDEGKAVRFERRRSLPTRSSTLSLASQFNLSSPSPEMASFQARRRQAAKLTHFFGVDYRDLIGDILESIEHDVEEESHRGSLHPEEIQDLMVKLRNLKTKRTAVI